jgi:hypothetical protein
MEIKTAVYLSNNIKKGKGKVHSRTGHEDPVGE